MYNLYGDGIHDDQPAIQEMLDSGSKEIKLPTPAKNYLITKTLEIPSDCSFSLPRHAVIKLADGANCFMLKNKTVYKPAKRLHPEMYNHKASLGERGAEVAERADFFVNDYSPDEADTTRNITVCGGIWDCNNMGQKPNPQRGNNFDTYGYVGYGMLFYNVKDLTLKEMTLKDPVNFSVTLDRVSDFTVRDVEFDFNLGNPVPLNMDGIHVNGNCRSGVIENLSGACYDDLVALNADEGSFGPITNIKINNISAENCHSAVRLLTVKNAIENIRITNVSGTYYQYGIGFTNYYKGSVDGYFDGIALEDLNISKADREPIRKLVAPVVPKWGAGRHFSPVWIQENAKVKTITVRNLHRVERINPIETITVGENAEIDELTLENIVTENHTGQPMPLFKNSGTVKNLIASGLKTDGDEIYTGNGVIENKN